MPLDIQDGVALSGDARLAALRDTALLDSAPEESFDRLTRLASRLLGVPVSLVSLVDANRQFFKSQHGLPAALSGVRETPLTHSFCKHVVASGQPLMIADAADDPLVVENLARRDLGVVAYLGVPLTTADGQTLGSLCAISGAPRVWDATDLATLQDLAAIAMTEIALRAGLRERDRAQDKLAVLAGELQHRVKNCFATTQAIVHLSLRTATSLQGLNEVVAQRLASLAATQDLLAAPGRDGIPLRSLLRRELEAFMVDDRVTLAGPEVDLDAEQGAALGMIVHELVTNAAKYGALHTPAGRIAVSWSCVPNGSTPRLDLTWRESGVSIDPSPQRRGFGSALMDRLARTALRGTAVPRFEPSGLVVSITADLEG